MKIERSGWSSGGGEEVRDSVGFNLFSENPRKNAKKFYENLLGFSLSTGAKECQYCRYRKMLKNAYLDAKIGFDTEENEPSKVL